jgi:predicted ATPase
MTTSRDDVSVYVESVEFGSWPILGGELTLNLDHGCTVLVGRNAAGKSLILEGLYSGFRTAIGIKQVRPRGPNRFAATFGFSDGRKLRYSYSQTSTPNVRDSDERDRAPWTERCEWLGEPNVAVWDLADGEGSLNGSTKVVIAGPALPALSNMKTPVREAEIVETLFAMTRLVTAGVPRDRAHRIEYIARKDRPQMSMDRRIGRMARTISTWHESRPERFDELVELGRRIGVLRQLSIRTLAGREPGAEDELIDVQVDGANIGVLSDGTLRVIETLVSVQSSLVLLLEEPETGIHPGLLTRLLSVLESYADDRQLIISTHSPQLVSWAKPRQLRIVERSEGGTTVRSLDERQTALACQHLEDANLGDFVYGGGADPS